MAAAAKLPDHWDPYSPIRTALDRLDNRTRNAARVRKYLDAISADAEEILTLVDNLKVTKESKRGLRKLATNLVAKTDAYIEFDDDMSEKKLTPNQSHQKAVARGKLWLALRSSIDELAALLDPSG